MTADYSDEIKTLEQHLAACGWLEGSTVSDDRCEADAHLLDWIGDFVRRRYRNRVDAASQQDLAQDVWLRLLLQVERAAFRDGSHFTASVKLLAEQVHIDRLRRSGGQANRSLEGVASAAHVRRPGSSKSQTRPSEAFSRNERGVLLSEAMNQLSIEDQDLFRDATSQTLTMAQLTEKYQMTEYAIRKAVARISSTMRQLLPSEGE